MSHGKSSYSYEDLLACAHGELFGPGNAQLPLPPMLMFDRVIEVNETGGAHGKGEIIAEMDVRPDLWFFKCHFENDPVMPGCLGLDALWQMLGFYLGWLGQKGRGRAFGVGEVKFSGMVVPDIRLLRFHVSIKRLMVRRLILAIADGVMMGDGKIFYECSDLKVGLFTAA